MRLRRPPAALVVLLAVAAVELLVWSIAVPALQEPDEAAHFTYVQAIAERHEIPWDTSGGPLNDLRRSSSELRTAALWAGLEPLRANAVARPAWTAADTAVWSGHDRALGPGAKRDIRPVSTFSNPPLAYAYDAVPYAVAGGSFFDRLFAARWANLPWLLVVVAATWLLARELFPRRPALVVLATAIVALQPLLVSVAGGVTPDALLAALTACVLLASVLVVRHGLSRRRVAVLAALCAATALTHGRGLAVLVPAVVAVALAWWRARPPAERPEWVPRFLPAALVLAGLVALRYTEHGTLSLERTRGFASYLWQFYLPPLPGMGPPPFPDWGVRQVFVERLYVQVGQFEIALPAWVTSALIAAGLALLAVGLAALVARRRALRRRWPVLAVLAAGLAGGLGLVHLQAYRSLLADPHDPFITGRYLLPYLPLLGVGVAAAVGALPRRAAGAAGGVVLGAAVFLQLAAMGAMVTRFYA